jgi:DNA mismatch repair protein MutL
VHGGAFAGRLLEVDDVSGTTHVSGLVERPADVGTSTRRIFISINGRAIGDSGIVRSAEAAYRSTIPAGVRPTLFLDIVVAADMVDVNVHPAKAEVRFRDRWQVERTVETAVRRALGTFDAGATFGRPSWAVPPSIPRPPEPLVAAVDVEALSAAPLEESEGLFEPAAEQRDTAAPAPREETTRRQADVPPLVQLRRTYLMFEHDDGVVLIDQHSAHERVLYERFMGMLERGEAPSQRLLFPLTLHLSPAESDAFEANREPLAQLGFEVEGFGGHTLLVNSVPMPHPRFDAEQCLRETLATLAGDREGAAHTRHERLAATVACKAAVKAGDELSQAEMRALFIALSATTLPAHDVHGRSTIVQLSWPELERRFGRQ